MIKLSLGIFALVVVLLIVLAGEMMPALRALVTCASLALATLGIYFYFGGWLELERARGNRGIGVKALLTGVGFSIPMGCLLAPVGLILLPLLGALAFLLAPVMVLLPQSRHGLPGVRHWRARHRTAYHYGFPRPPGPSSSVPENPQTDVSVSSEHKSAPVPQPAVERRPSPESGNERRCSSDPASIDIQVRHAQQELLRALPGTRFETVKAALLFALLMAALILVLGTCLSTVKVEDETPDLPGKVLNFAH